MLLIDADPQTNATQVFIHPDREIDLVQSLYNVIINFSPLSTGKLIHWNSPNDRQDTLGHSVVAIKEILCCLKQGFHRYK